MNDIMDLHTHTVASGHAYNTLYEMAKSASEKGLALMGSTDHAPKMPGTCHEFYFINFKVIPRKIYGVNILMGVELNIMDHTGRVDLRKGLLEKMDYSIASLHEPCYKSGTSSENTRAYLGAIENPLIHIIGHPDDSRFPVDYDTLVSAAAENHTLLELNSSSLHPLSARMNAAENYRTMLELCKRYKASIIIDSDAHTEADVGNHVRALELIEELKFPEELIVNTSLNKLIPYIPKLEAYL
ncbi:phosphatase [Lacrimispora celerecrescens]|uniref:Putative hydrolase n=1 Tax=[Clostridium] celerecrescens 18A TaxID=1286362 RepID=A0A2M8ZB35_9FIRM|nr:phosphatase [Lacrimispora celerecrescens]PJJ30635.1 putative hydrolase [[Clostridium] celerecrescens 18A]